MLDPIKVTVTTPGNRRGGHVAERGIPAQIVTLFLSERRIEIEKTGDYTFLVLFSIGMTKGKWGTLIDGLFAFKRAYDREPAARRRDARAWSPPSPIRYGGAWTP